VLLGLMHSLYQRRRRALLAAERLGIESRTGALTALGNRRAFDESVRREMVRARRQSCPVTLLLVDIDHLEWVNDHLGHQQGDLLIQRLGEALRRCCRADQDQLFRIGGDELEAILPGAGEREARLVKDRIEHSYSVDGLVRQPRQHFSCSVGAVILRAGGEPESWLARADTAMCAAKVDRRPPLAALPA
jgi:diguanylate cyclase (GGDEF)-like protein